MRRLILLAGTLVSLTPAVRAAAQTLPVDWTVQAEDLPEKKPWTDPAAISFKSVDKGDDIWDVAISVKGETALGTDHTLFASGAVIRRTATGKEQEFYAAKIGANLLHSTVGQFSDPATDVTTYFDPAIGYARTTVFKDAKASCATPPLSPNCFKQHEESLRIDMKIQPYMRWMSNTAYQNAQGDWTTRKGYFRTIGFILMPFHDRIINAKLDAQGVKQKGSASGLQSVAAIALSPDWLDYGFILRASGKYMIAADRTGPRRSAFPANAFLFETSATYEFSNRSFEGTKGWTPSFGVAYASGDDPLTGRKKSSDTTIALKLSYKK